MKEIPFQQNAINKLIKKTSFRLDNPEDTSKHLLFTSCTGSGKTVMITQYMDELFATHGDVSFVWLSMGDGGLVEQSKKKIKVFSRKLNILEDHMLTNKACLDSGDIYFANFEKIKNPEINILRTDGDFASIDTAFKNTKSKIIVIIDEAHDSVDTYKTKKLLDIINYDIVLFMTATPKESFPELNMSFGPENTIEVPIEDVIDAGLIKKRTLLNVDLGDGIDTKSILNVAIQKRDEIERRFETLKIQYKSKKIVPLLLVQIENDKKGSKNADDIFEKLIALGLKEEDIAIWLDGKKERTENIEESDIKVLIVKLAVAQGWDCPRAHVLVKFRENTTDSLTVQTLGRILRTINHEHYGDDLLDTAFVYSGAGEERISIDDDFLLNKTVISDDNEVRISYDTLDEAEKFFLEKFTCKKEVCKNGEVPKISFSTIRSICTDIENYKDTNGEFRINEDNVKISIISGKIEHKNINKDSRNDEVSTKKVTISDDAIREEYNNIFKKNNRDGLGKEILKSISEKDDTSLIQIKRYLSNKSIIDSFIKKHTPKKQMVKDIRDYSIPTSNYYSKIVEKPLNSKYLYTKMPDLSVQAVRSKTEGVFASFLDNCDTVVWWFKNTGLNKFTIVYEVEQEEGGKLFKIQKTYEPDFIIKTKDSKLYILDTKAPFGEKDIDEHVGHKFMIGKAYEEEEKDLILSEMANAGVVLNDIIISIVKYKDLTDNTPMICDLNSKSYSENIDEGWVKFLS